MTEVVFVGTSDAFGAGGRRQAAILARGARGSALIDCGVTTNTGLADLGIRRDEIEAICVSHFHGDHFGGIPLFLFAALYEDHRKHPIHIAGPPEVEARVRALAHAMGFSLDGRDWSFPIEFVELPHTGTFDVGPIRVRSFETQHQLEAHPHGFRVDTGGHTISYSGDTGWFDKLPHAVEGSDLFICECTNHTRRFDFHLTHEELVEHRDEFDCGRIVLTHLGEEMTDRRGQCAFDTADDGLTLKL